MYSTELALSVTIDSIDSEEKIKGGGVNMIHNMFEDFFVIKWYQYKYFKHRRQISTLNWDTDYWKINTFFIFFFTEISC